MVFSHNEICCHQKHEQQFFSGEISDIDFQNAPALSNVSTLNATPFL